jgi:hypothetical protein
MEMTEFTAAMTTEGGYYFSNKENNCPTTL